VSAGELVRPDAQLLPDIIRPVRSAHEMLAAYREFQEAQAELLDADDVVEIDGKLRKKKSAWRKLATWTSVSLHKQDSSYQTDDHGRVISADFTAVATAPNGRECDGWGGAHVTAKCCRQGCRKRHTHCPAATDGVHTDPWAHWGDPYHDLRALAETRAKNRAIADLIAFGEVSAEEINGGEGNGNDDGGSSRSRERPRREQPSRRPDELANGWADLDEQERAWASLGRFLSEHGLREWAARLFSEKGIAYPVSKSRYRWLRGEADRAARAGGEQEAERQEQRAHDAHLADDEPPPPAAAEDES
jgi:hypothetical protein